MHWYGYLQKNWRSHAFYFIGFQVHSEIRGSHIFLLYTCIKDKFMEYCDSKVKNSPKYNCVIVVEATCKLRVIKV